MGNAATSFALPLGYSGFARTVAWREGLESKSPQAMRQQQIPIQQLPRQMRTDVFVYRISRSTRKSGIFYTYCRDGP